MNQSNIVNQYLQRMAPQRALNMLISGHSSLLDKGNAESRQEESGIDPSELMSVRTFEKRLKAKGYSNQEAKRFASYYNKMKQHVEAQHCREGGSDTDTVAAIKQLTKKIKQL